MNGPKPGFGGQGRKTDRRRRRRSHDRGAPGSKVPWKIDHSVLPSPFRSWNLAMRKSTPLRVEKRLRPVVPLGRNRVGPLPRNRVVPFRRNQVGPFRRNPAPRRLKPHAAKSMRSNISSVLANGPKGRSRSPATSSTCSTPLLRNARNASLTDTFPMHQD